MVWAWIIKNAIYLVSALAVVVGALWLFQTLILGPMNAKHDAAAASGQAAIGGAGQASAADAIQRAYDNGLKAGKTDAVTRTNTIYIRQQPGANDAINPALFAAFVKSVCMRDSAAGLPECNGLRQSGP